VECLFTRHPAAGVEKIRCGLLADGTRQHVGQPESRGETELDEVGGESGLRAADAEVGIHGEPEPAANRRTLYRGNHLLFVAEEPHGLPVERVTLPRLTVAASFPIFA